MMNPIIQSPLRKLKLLLIIPVSAGILYAFAMPEYRNNTETEALNENSQETKVVIGNITWEGNSVYTADELNKALDIKKGDTYSQKQIDQQLYHGPVSDLYLNNGYLFFNVEPVPTKKSDGRTDFTFKIFEGGLYQFRKIELRGNKNVPDDILRVVSIRSGELFSKEKLIESTKSLVKTGNFVAEEVSPDVKPDLSTQGYTVGMVDIVFNVVEK
ncbi:POTRA domain-containing protein [Maribellus sp. CM-23]|uniref:POTRA domain-containing protein n=1 Tax=Maribellus sp. CM-23 TaxID=2781026 RepID=UPI001F288E35|nr:POTRA domain-containing protein [Maribellus sp. CM-23]